MKKFTCVPTMGEDVILVTNGSQDQIERTLVLLNEHTCNLIPLHANIIIFNSFKDFVTHLDRTRGDSPVSTYLGITVFMFFNGVEFIQDVLCGAIDYEHRLLASMAEDAESFHLSKLSNSYFYFDGSISVDYERASPASLLRDGHQFHALMAVAHDIMKKTSFMLSRVRGVLVDDIRADGERVYPLSRFVQNFPNVDRLELSSSAPILMTNMLM